MIWEAMMATRTEVTRLEQAVQSLIAVDEPSADQVHALALAAVGVVGLLLDDVGRIASALEQIAAKP